MCKAFRDEAEQYLAYTAIGRTPPLFFLQARRVAPQRCGTTSGGVWPPQSRCTKLERALRICVLRSGEGHFMASFRWFALSPDGPGVEPLGKDVRALRTFPSEMSGGRGAGAVGV